MAVGQIGMRLNDFCALTPSEFRSVHGRWQEAEEARERAGWERARMLATYAVQPYSKKRLKPSDLMTFPWERPDTKNAAAPERSSAERMKELEARLK